MPNSMANDHFTWLRARVGLASPAAGVGVWLVCAVVCWLSEQLSGFVSSFCEGMGSKSRRIQKGFSRFFISIFPLGPEGKCTWGEQGCWAGELAKLLQRDSLSLHCKSCLCNAQESCLKIRWPWAELLLQQSRRSQVWIYLSSKTNSPLAPSDWGDAEIWIWEHSWPRGLEAKWDPPWESRGDGPQDTSQPPTPGSSIPIGTREFSSLQIKPLLWTALSSLL